jgi:ATP-binding cassette subfamily F protein 3
LLQVLKQFTGTILFVSHDRSFLNELSTHILDLTSDGIFKYDGNYDSYLIQKQERNNVDDVLCDGQEKVETIVAKQSNKELYVQRKEIKKLENRIEKLEREIVSLSKALSEIEYGTDGFFGVSSKLKLLEKKLEESFKQWEKLNG